MQQKRVLSIQETVEKLQSVGLDYTYSQICQLVNNQELPVLKTQKSFLDLENDSFQEKEIIELKFLCQDVDEFIKRRFSAVQKTVDPPTNFLKIVSTHPLLSLIVSFAAIFAAIFALPPFWKEIASKTDLEVSAICAQDAEEIHFLEFGKIFKEQSFKDMGTSNGGSRLKFDVRNPQDGIYTSLKTQVKATVEKVQEEPKVNATLPTCRIDISYWEPPKEFEPEITLAAGSKEYSLSFQGGSGNINLPGGAKDTFEFYAQCKDPGLYNLTFTLLYDDGKSTKYEYGKILCPRVITYYELIGGTYQPVALKQWNGAGFDEKDFP